MRTPLWALSALCVACSPASGAPPSAAPPSGPPPAFAASANGGSEAPTPNALPPRRRELRQDVIGRYHLEGVADVVNLELYGDGAFRLSVNGCDYGSLECGRWEERDGQVVLLPRAGAANVLWFAQSSFRAEVKELTVRASEQGLHAEGASRHAGPFVQEWASGGVCAICGGEAPTGQTACDTPIADCGR